MKKKRSTTKARSLKLDEGRQRIKLKLALAGYVKPPGTFSAADWRDIYDALMDAANWYHSGPRADRTVELARKIREEVLS